MALELEQATGKRCPICESPLDQQRYVEVETKIRSREKRKLEDQRRELEDQFRRDAEEQRKVVEEKAGERAQRQISEATDKTRREMEKKQAEALEKLSTEESRKHATLLAQVEKLKRSANDSTSKLKTAQAERAEAIKKAEEAARDSAARIARAVETATAKLQSEHVEELAKKAALLKSSEEQVTNAAKERDAAIAHNAKVAAEAEIAKKEAVEAASNQVRTALEKDRDEALLKQHAEFTRKQEALQKKFSEVQRKLDEKTANELGDGAEIDLYDSLRDQFPEDEITRVKKGERGADIKISVRHKGEVAGVVLIDSKNRKSWQSNFATKLREDQVEADADYAILSTTVFPKNKRQLSIESDVIVASPGRVSEIVQIVRSALVKLHVLGLSRERRAEKREALYEYITSENFRLKLGEMERLTEQLLELDVRELRQHQSVWKKRGTMLKKQQHAVHGIDVDVSAIVQGERE